MLVTSVAAAMNAMAAGPSLQLSSPPAQSAASQPVDTMKLVDSLLAKTPSDPQLRFRKAVLLADQKRSAEAIAMFRKLADDYPLLPEPQNNLAVLYAERGEPDKARAALEAACAAGPLTKRFIATSAPSTPAWQVPPMHAR
jgi:colicin import membrane protein